MSTQSPQAASPGAENNPSLPKIPPSPPAARTVASYERRDVRAVIARLRNQ